MTTAFGRWVRSGNAIVLAEPAAEELELAFEAAPSAGLRVRWVQEALNIVLGRGLAVDGIRGPQTRGAIVDFQSSRGRVADGILGPATAGALREALLARATAAPPCPGVGQPAEELVGFAFDDHRLQPRHLVQSGKLARCSAASQATSVRIVGHTDPVGRRLLQPHARPASRRGRREGDARGPRAPQPGRGRAHPLRRRHARRDRADPRVTRAEPQRAGVRAACEAAEAEGAEAKTPRAQTRQAQDADTPGDRAYAPADPRRPRQGRDPADEERAGRYMDEPAGGAVDVPCYRRVPSVRGRPEGREQQDDPRTPLA